ncbi:hypothetical protein [Cutibacterium sp. V947]|uniref:hypothetical protein n=1 Tax=unclassified Cutibacterium TaxID=2649671 RepID=UPI003EE3B052
MRTLRARWVALTFLVTVLSLAMVRLIYSDTIGKVNRSSATIDGEDNGATPEESGTTETRTVTT